MVFQVNESNTLSIITHFVSKQRVQCLGNAKFNGFSGYFTCCLSVALSFYLSFLQQYAEKWLFDATNEEVEESRERERKKASSHCSNAKETSILIWQCSSQSYSFASQFIFVCKQKVHASM